MPAMHRRVKLPVTSVDELFGTHRRGVVAETAPRPPQPSTVNLMGGLVSVVIAGSGFDDRELYLVFDSIQLASESTGERYIKQEK